VRFSITVGQIATVKAAIAAISEDAWTDIDYPDGGRAQVAATLPGPAGGRLIVRRTGAQATLCRTGTTTDRAGDAVALDADHRQHAVCELAIRDLKQGAGAAPLAFRALPRQCGLAGACGAGPQPAALGRHARAWPRRAGRGKDLRGRLLILPGRLTRSARRRRLHLPGDWPWARQFLAALARLPTIPLGI
jgi:hypothetical protein